MCDMSPTIEKKDTVQAVAIAEINNKRKYPISVTLIERINQIFGDESSNKRPKNNRSVRIFHRMDNFEIDEGDYCAVAKLVRSSTERSLCETNDYNRDLQAVIRMVTIRAEDKDRRVAKLCVQDYCLETLLHNNDNNNAIIGLDALEVLVLELKNTKEFPRWIGTPKNLKELRIRAFSSLRALPDDIGNMTNLEKLVITYSRIELLPNTIWNLKNLKVLDLNSMNLQSLPDEIGNLTKLEKLNISKSGIRSIPKSIGNLENLKELNLSSIMNLQSIPDEIGNLTTLEKLHISNSRIRSLPNSIGNLENLKEFDLSLSEELKSLPYEIANLAHLEKLDLRSNPIIGSKVPNKVLLNCIQRCRLLGCIGLDEEKVHDTPEYEKCIYDLSCNRARSRVVISRKGEFISFPSALWARIFHQASSAFEAYLFCDYTFCEHKSSTPSQADAIFHLLLERGVKDIFITKASGK